MNQMFQSQHPYQRQQMYQLQQMFPQQNQYMYQQPTINGKLVSNAAEITPQDVARDGSISWFPKSDGSEIYAKQMMNDGSIAMVTYVPKEMPEPTPSTEQLINEKLDKIIGWLTPVENEVTNE